MDADARRLVSSYITVDEPCPRRNEEDYGMARRNPRNVTYLEPVPPRLAQV